MKTITIILVAIVICILTSCSTTTSPIEQNTILTDDVLLKLENTLDTSMESTTIPGLIAGVFTDEGESWISTRGVSNIETDEPMNENCHFRIGSVTKTFVASVILQLVDEGLVQLDNPVSTYLHELSIPAGDTITVRMLGNMTSGLIDYSVTEEMMTIAASGEVIFTPERLAYLCTIYPLNFAPGTDFDYSNTNYVLLGMIIEKVTGKTVKKNLEERIFEPLELENTSWPITRFLPTPYAHGYARSFTTGTLDDFSFYQPSWMDAAGILISNIYDVKKYACSLTRGELVSSAGFTAQTNYNLISNTPYGPVQYGFGLTNFWGWVGHSGATPGYCTAMYHNIEKGITIIVLTNYQVDPDLPAENIFVKLSTVFN